MNLLDLLDRPIAFHRPLVTVTGSVHAALMLSQAIYWSRRTTDKDGWFYKTQDEWRSETGLTRAEQESARKHLVKSGCWDERYERLEHRMWYRVNSRALGAMLKSSIGECGNASVPNAEIQHSLKTEITSETTINSGALPLELEPGSPGKRRRRSSLSTLALTEAEVIYAEYPKKVGRPVAIKSIAKAVSGFGMEHVLERTKAYAKVRKGDIEFCPNPATWFNQQRFNDDPKTWVNGNGKNGHHSPSPDPNKEPDGWKEWLDEHPEYKNRYGDQHHRFFPEFVRLEFSRHRKAILTKAPTK